jgi:hypothetical protein
MAFSFAFQVDGKSSPNLEIIVQPVCHPTAGSGVAANEFGSESHSALEVIRAIPR